MLDSTGTAEFEAEVVPSLRSTDDSLSDCEEADNKGFSRCSPPLRWSIAFGAVGIAGPLLWRCSIVAVLKLRELLLRLEDVCMA
jgi:hypothetical protein